MKVINKLTSLLGKLGMMILGVILTILIIIGIIYFFLFVVNISSESYKEADKKEVHEILDKTKDKIMNRGKEIKEIDSFSPSKNKDELIDVDKLEDNKKKEK